MVSGSPPAAGGDGAAGPPPADAPPPDLAGGVLRALAAALSAQLLPEDDSPPDSPAEESAEDGARRAAEAAGPPTAGSQPAATKWEALRGALAAVGGERVHRMLAAAATDALRRAEAAPEAAASGVEAAGGREGLRRAAHLSDCAWDIAWEKLHIGDWKASARGSAASAPQTAALGWEQTCHSLTRDRSLLLRRTPPGRGGTPSPPPRSSARPSWRWAAAPPGRRKR